MTEVVPVSEDHQREPLAFVGLGASAGGLAALQHFFEHTPVDSGAAFIVVMHLSSEYESHLAELLQTCSKMPVRQVTEDQKIDPNSVYVIPPGRNLSAIDTHLRLSPLEEKRRERAPIDHFFRTLSEVHGDRAVAVVLSGSGSDGAVGLSLVKERGGLAIAQDPAEADYDSMPQSAIMTGLVDAVLSLSEMPGKIVQYLTHEPQVHVPDEDAPLPESEAELLQKIFTQLRARTSHDFSSYKRATLMRRIARRMQLRETETLGGYLELLRRDQTELDRLYSDMLITVTNFFRDPEVFGAVEHEVIPRLFENKGPGDQLRVWVVGCATGEEAYSLAMLLLEHASELDSPPEIQVFATDVAPDALIRAREGLYPGAIAADVPEDRLERFFVQEGESYRVKKMLRERVLFAPHNFLSDPPFSHLDLIACRNVLIYIRREVQQDVFKLFHYALRKEGFLLLGTSESVEGGELFLELDKKTHLHQRRNVVSADLQLPNLPYAQPSAVAVASAPAQPETPKNGYGELHQQLVERYAPPSVLIDGKQSIVHLSERAGRYLQNPGGEPTHDLLRRIRSELRGELRAVLYDATEPGKLAVSRPVALSLEGQPRDVTLRASRSQEAHNAGMTLVFFDEHDPSVASEPNEPLQSDARIVGRLETELEAAHERQRTLTEEYETSREEMQASNEELQSINEELRSTAEELETSKEELQSINEELVTLNQENKHKVEELSQLTSDLQNLFAATDVATLFLDRESCIKRFTPKVHKLFNILASDIGRPLTHLTHKLGRGEFVEDAQQVLKTLVPVEREVQNNDGVWYLMKLHPYRTAEDRIDGVVLTFVEIDRIKRSEAAVRQSEARYRALVSQSVAGICSTAPDGHFTFVNDTFCALTGYTCDELLALRLDDIIDRDDRSRSAEHLKQMWQTGEPFELEQCYLRKDGSTFWVHSSVSPLFDDAGAPQGAVMVVIDISRRQQAETELKTLNETLEQRVAEQAEDLVHSDQRFFQAFQIGPVAACLTSLGEERLIEMNDAFLQLTGYERGEAQGKTAAELGMWSSPEDRRQLRDAQKNHHSFRNLELQLRRKDGQTIDILVSGELTHLHGEQLYLKMFYDITQRKRTDKQMLWALQDVMKDASWFSSGVMERLANLRLESADSSDQPVELSSRERQVLERLATGLGNETIAAELGLKTQTVRNYISTLYSKLDVHTRAEAIIWARERGIIGA